MAKKYVWDSKAQGQFDQLKQDVIKNAGLFCLFKMRNFFIQTDSSETSLGGVVYNLSVYNLFIKKFNENDVKIQKCESILVYVHTYDRL